MSKQFTREEQKTLGIKRLNQLNIYKPYIRKFENHDVVTVFENYGGFYATADNGFEELETKIKTWEAETGNLVYAATHEFLEFGECYSFLFVSQNSEDEDEEIEEFEEGPVDVQTSLQANTETTEENEHDDQVFQCRLTHSSPVFL